LAWPKFDQLLTISPKFRVHAQDTFRTSQSYLVGGAAIEVELIVDLLGESRRDVAGPIGEAVEAICIIRIILLLPFDIIDDLDLVFVQLRDVLSRSKALAASRVHLEHSFLLCEGSKSLDNSIVVYFSNAW
jgi:hypothetical protein